MIPRRIIKKDEEALHFQKKEHSFLALGHTCVCSERDVVHDEKESETFYSTDRRQQELCLACESFTNYIVLLFLLKGFLFKSKEEIRRKKECI